MSFGNSRRRNQRGSALLIVFVFAAVLAVTLFMEMPVLIFEAQRDKEQLLIDRGSEYSQAVKLYLRKTGQYPPNIEALENTNRVRFLRKKFKDPFTDKADWRLLHAGPNGVLIDSKLKINKNGPALGSALGTFASNGNNQTSPFGGTSNGNTGFGSSSGFGQNNAAATNRTPFASSGFNSNSDQFGSSGNTAGFNNQFPTNTGAAPVKLVGNGLENPVFRDGIAPNADGIDPTQVPGGAVNVPQIINPDGTTTTIAPRTPSFARSQVPNGTNGSITGADPSQAPGFASANTGLQNDQNTGGPQNPNAAVSGLFSNPNSPTPQRSGFGSSSGPSAAFGSNSFGSSQSASSNSASSGFGSSNFGNTQNGGLAGVASKAERHSIKVVNEQEDYSLWEFYYDPSKDPTRNGSGALAQAGGVNTGQSTNPGIQQGNSFGQQSSPFGQRGTGGQGSPFGQSNAFGGSNPSGVQQGGFGSSNSGFGGFNSNNGGFGSNSQTQTQPANPTVPPNPTQPPQ